MILDIPIAAGIFGTFLLPILLFMIDRKGFFTWLKPQKFFIKISIFLSSIVIFPVTMYFLLSFSPQEVKIEIPRYGEDLKDQTNSIYGYHALDLDRKIYVFIKAGQKYYIYPTIKLEKIWFANKIKIGEVKPDGAMYKIGVFSIKESSLEIENIKAGMPVDKLPDYIESVNLIDVYR